MALPVVAVSGKNGQLGSELQQLTSQYPNYQFVFASRNELNLADETSIYTFFNLYQPQYFINCAAYTAVDRAEQHQEEAYKINAEAVGVIARCCKEFDTTLIQISTDYVFNGNGTKPYQTEDAVDPVNYYGYTKWLGEKLAVENWKKTIVIRTSWVYSEYGNNFVKTMMRLMKDRAEISVVNDQIGCPTYAADLAAAIMQILPISSEKNYGIYHYSNEGVISWFDFAVVIKKIANYPCNIKPITSQEYPTPAKRPHYSVMDLSKIKEVFGVNTSDWGTSLGICMSKMM